MVYENNLQPVHVPLLVRIPLALSYVLALGLLCHIKMKRTETSNYQDLKNNSKMCFSRVCRRDQGERDRKEVQQLRRQRHLSQRHQVQRPQAR